MRKINPPKSERLIQDKRYLSLLADYVSEMTQCDIRSKCRDNDHVFARMVYINVSNAMICASLREVGDVINRDHASVIYNQKNSFSVFASNEFYNDLVELSKQWLLDQVKTEALAGGGELSKFQELRLHIDRLETYIRELTFGQKAGYLEHHEQQYRLLDSDKQAVYRERVNAILKMI